MRLNNQSGFILIMTLWVLGFLTVLALAVGFGARQKIMVLERLEDRSRHRLAAEAGAKKAMAVLLDDQENSQMQLTAAGKLRRHNNPAEFSNIQLGDSQFSVVYRTQGEGGDIVSRNGLSDEQAKINVNTVDRETFARLLGRVLGLKTDEARAKAESIIDWRDFGKHEAEGFFSDQYYQNLEYPYKMKETPFERIDELLLVKDMTTGELDALRPFITVWGDGKININTVSAQVLLSLGLDQEVVDKILYARRGNDGYDATEDDHIFYKVYDIASDVSVTEPLSDAEAKQIDQLNAANVFGTGSVIYSFQSVSGAPDGEETLASVDAVFNSQTSKILFWREK